MILPVLSKYLYKVICVIPYKDLSIGKIYEIGVKDEILLRKEIK